MGRIVEVGSMARRAGCWLGGGWPCGMGVGRIVEVGSRARKVVCR